MSPLEVWYDRLVARTIIDMAPNAKIRKIREQLLAQAQQRLGDYLYPKISGEVGGRRRLIDQPPVYRKLSIGAPELREARTHGPGPICDRAVLDPESPTCAERIVYEYPAQATVMPRS